MEEKPLELSRMFRLWFWYRGWSLAFLFLILIKNLMIKKKNKSKRKKTMDIGFDQKETTPYLLVTVSYSLGITRSTRSGNRQVRESREKKNQKKKKEKEDFDLAID